jgi:hypothetical protein
VLLVLSVDQMMVSMPSSKDETRDVNMRDGVVGVGLLYDGCGTGQRRLACGELDREVDHRGRGAC